LFSGPDAQAKIAKSPVLKRLDELCTDIPLPPEFELVYKTTFSKNKISAVEHQFKTAGKVEFEKVKNFYVAWSKTDDWVINGGSQLAGMASVEGSFLQFVRGNTSVSIANGEFDGGATYSLSCSESK
jgi:hypothetical protein